MFVTPGKEVVGGGLKQADQDAGRISGLSHRRDVAEMANETVGHLLKAPWRLCRAVGALLHRQSASRRWKDRRWYMRQLVPRGQRSVSVSRLCTGGLEHAAAAFTAGLFPRDRFEIKRGGFETSGEMEFGVDVREII